jgi:hypothetical protein
MPHKDIEARRKYHRERNRVFMREKRRADPAAARIREADYRERNPAGRLLQSTRQSSKLKNLEHNITINDLKLPEYCPYLGIKIDYTAGNGKTMLKPSVDRIDPTKGYIKGNVEVISSLANTMKNKSTTEQLQKFALEILRRWPV